MHSAPWGWPSWGVALSRKFEDVCRGFEKLDLAQLAQPRACMGQDRGSLRVRTDSGRIAHNVRGPGHTTFSLPARYLDYPNRP